LNGLILIRVFISTADGIGLDLNLKTIVQESFIPFTFFVLRTRAVLGKETMALVSPMIPFLDFNRFLIRIRAQMSRRFSKILFLLLNIIL
jgi:hypothetical protein